MSSAEPVREGARLTPDMGLTNLLLIDTCLARLLTVSKIQTTGLLSDNIPCHFKGV